MENKYNLLDKGFIELIDHLGNDKTIVNAARISYLSQDNSGEQQDTKLIQYLIAHNHTSPLEQVEFQFLVKCPLFVARQWMRHRTWSYNEMSRRYTNKEIEFYYPRILTNNNTLLQESDVCIDIMRTHCKLSLGVYEYLLESGVSKEQARMILPQNIYTTFYAKTDLHNLFHFLELRNTEHAQMEIRIYAEAIEELIKPFIPITYDAWRNKLKKEQAAN